MSFRTRVTILGGLALLLMITLTIGVLRSPRRRPAAGAGVALIVPGTSDRVTRVAIDGRDTVGLQRDRDGNWWLEAGERLLPARDDRVDELLRVLGDGRTTRRVTADRELWPDFGLDRQSARRITLYGSDGQELVTVAYGRRTHAGGEAYVRRGASAEVFTVDAAPLFYLERDSVYWMELRLFASLIGSDAITRLELSADIADPSGLWRRFAYRLRRDGSGTWLLADNRGERVARQSRVRELLAALVALEGARVAPAAATPAAAAVAELEFTLQDASRYQVLVYDAANGDQFIMRAAGPGVPLDGTGEPIHYRVNAWTLERVFRPPEDIINIDGPNEGD
ncbi:MAG: DUF4340 domain-containing protein [Spirochaetaceae bacterium]|nr:MAG: DUF4340 domain-containing protein [Spirochaetaceae bacterium]